VAAQRHPALGHREAIDHLTAALRRLASVEGPARLPEPVCHRSAWRSLRSWATPLPRWRATGDRRALRPPARRLATIRRRRPLAILSPTR
jgi:hypothetical protein